MRIGRCSLADLPAILDMVNDLILNTTVIYDYEPRSLETMIEWFEKKEAKQYPINGFYADDGSLLGISTYGQFRERQAYKYAIEHSVYVRADSRGKGIGTALMKVLIEDAREGGYHAMIGGIDSSNEGSLRMHERLGFAEAGRIRQAGYKFGRWLDLVFCELVLDTPANPCEP